MNAPTGKEVSARPPAPLSVSVIPVLDASTFEQMQRVATAMAAASLTPSHLRGGTREETIGNCFLIVNQAVRWNVDPIALAQCAYVLKGKLGYEGKVIAGVVTSRLAERLNYEYSGEGDKRTVVVAGKIPGEKNVRTVTGTVGEYRTGNEMWTRQPDQQLAYRGAVVWARRHMPDVLLGIYSDDELGQMMNLVLDPVTNEYVPEEPRPTRPEAKAEIVGTDNADGMDIPDEIKREATEAIKAKMVEEETEDRSTEQPEALATGSPSPANSALYQILDMAGEVTHEGIDAHLATAALRQLLDHASSEDAINALLEFNEEFTDRLREEGHGALAVILGIAEGQEPDEESPLTLPDEMVVKGVRGGQMVGFAPAQVDKYVAAVSYQFERSKTDAARAALWKHNQPTIALIGSHGTELIERWAPK
jgi:hypothetical protein